MLSVCAVKKFQNVHSLSIKIAGLLGAAQRAGRNEVGGRGVGGRQGG